MAVPVCVSDLRAELETREPALSSVSLRTLQLESRLSSLRCRLQSPRPRLRFALRCTLSFRFFVRFFLIFDFVNTGRRIAIGARFRLYSGSV